MQLRWVLLGAFPPLIALSALIQEPLLQAACWITGGVALYTAFYAKRAFAAYGLLYLLAVAGVALFVEGKSWIGIFAGWELVSVAAWGLIVQSRPSARAQTVAFLTFAVNRLGDAFWLAAAFSQGRFPEGFLIAGFVKGGLFPFTFWLIQAMYAPAPVSALLHSALLVTLGVYWMVRYPEWGLGIDWGLWGKVAGVSGILAAIGALGSRHPKVILAWTTAAHLAAALRLTAQPVQMEAYLLEHAYLKAALFLLIGLTQKVRVMGPLTMGLSLVAMVLLVGSGAQADEFLLVTEGLVAVSLGKVVGGLRFAWRMERGSEFLLLLPVVLLVGKALAEGPLMPVPVLSVGILVGALIARWKGGWRLDRIFLWLFAGAFWVWGKVGRSMRWLDTQLTHAFDKFGLAFLAVARQAEKVESWASGRGWRAAAHRLRQGLTTLTSEGSPMPYAQALRWGLLITLGGGLIWRLLR